MVNYCAKQVVIGKIYQEENLVYRFFMFPFDAVTVYVEQIGAGTSTLVSGTGTKTILGLAIQQSNVSSYTQIACGSKIIAKNYSKDLPFMQISYYCDQPIYLFKTGNDDSATTLTYVARDIRTQKASTTPPMVLTANESMVMFGILLFILGIIMWRWIFSPVEQAFKK